MKKQTLYLIIAALAVLQLFSYIKISSLESSLQNANNTIRSVENHLNNQINSIYENVDSRLEEQASLVYHGSAVVGEVDARNLTVPVTFTVQPKAVTETMTVSLDFDGELIPLKKSGLEYSVTKDFTILDAISPSIVIEDQGVKNVGDYAGLQIMSLRERVLPTLFARFTGETSYGSREYRAKGRLNIDNKSPLLASKNPFVDIKYVIKVNDEVIKEIPVPLDNDIGFGGTFTLDIDEKYTLEVGQILTSHVVAVDSLGFVYEYLVTHFEAGSSAQREPYFEEEKITAPTGEVAYQYDAGNFTEIP